MEINRRKLGRENNPMDGKSRYLVAIGGPIERVVDYGNEFEGPIYVTEYEAGKTPDMKLGSIYPKDYERSEEAGWKESGKEMRECDDNYCEKNNIC
jgi:hypothetical protein